MYATLGTLAVALAAGIGYYQQLREAAYDRDRPLVIVLEDSTPLYKGNGSSYPLHSEMPTLPAGLEARLLHIRGRWLQIELSSGDVGWVPESAVIAVNPLFPG
jgi:hypothetical protein